MLLELHIQNFAIIQDLVLNFSSGLVVFTGETGAGKSIILDALSAVLGERVDQTSIRKGTDKAEIEAVFQLEGPAGEAVRQILAAEDLLDDPHTLTLAREIRAGGRNIARVNGRSVNASLQAEVGALLVDLHGQSEHLSLLKVRHHIELLDRFAHQDALLADYHQRYAEWSGLKADLEGLKDMQQFAKDRSDMLKYQIQEIETARLKPGEEQTLRQERDRLANAETLHSLSQQSLEALDEGNAETPPVSDLLGNAVQFLLELARIDPQMESLRDRADQALSTVADIAYEIRGYLDGIEFNPARLDQIEERLNTVRYLQRKYGGSTESVIQYLVDSRAELSNVETVEEQIEEVELKIAGIKLILAELAAQLSAGRKQAARFLTGGIETQLDRLQMKAARFMVQMERAPNPNGLHVGDEWVGFDSSGVDKVEFLIESNPGEGFKPLVKIASGGETSRLMLALKHVLAEVDHIPVLVFDEIDQGIGGRVGMTVGEMLWNLGREHQVMCVTHLPQLAAFGDQHIHVSKHEEQQRTLTSAAELSGETRERELASMVGAISAGTLQSARDILAAVEQITGKMEHS